MLCPSPMKHQRKHQLPVAQPLLALGFFARRRGQGRVERARMSTQPEICGRAICWRTFSFRAERLPGAALAGILSTGCGTKIEPASPAVSAKSPTGAFMKLSISYKNLEPDKSAEKEAERCANKLNRLLKSYEPDLVQLHGVFSKYPRRDEYSFSLNLSLPTATLHATGTGKNPRASCKQAFDELQAQVKKHQSRQRRDYEWKRKRPRSPAVALS